MTDVVARLLEDRPRFHNAGTSCWSALPGILHVVAEQVAPGSRTAETGCGASTVVFAAMGAYHTAISPDAREHDLVRDYCDRIGVDHTNATFVPESSDRVLPSAFSTRSLDFAFIDGAHGFPYAIVDWHYLSQALAVGGQMLVDDIPIPAIAPLFSFMRSEACWTLRGILDDRAAWFTLAAEPPPEDYNAQPFNRRHDYSFMAFPARGRVLATTSALRLRRAAGRRLPGLRTALQTRRGGDQTG